MLAQEIRHQKDVLGELSLWPCCLLLHNISVISSDEQSVMSSALAINMSPLKCMGLCLAIEGACYLVKVNRAFQF